MERYNIVYNLMFKQTKTYSNSKIMQLQEQKANSEHMPQSAVEDLPPAESGALPEPGTGAGHRPLPAVA